MSKKSINGKVDTVTSPVKSTVALEMFFISLNFLFVVVRRLAHGEVFVLGDILEVDVTVLVLKQFGKSLGEDGKQGTLESCRH